MKKMILLLAVVVLTTFGWAKGQIFLPTELPWTFNLPPTQPVLVEAGLRAEIEVKELYPNGTLKSLRMEMICPPSASQETKDLSKNFRLIVAEANVFVARFNWTVAKVKEDLVKKAEIQTRVASSFAALVNADKIDKKVVDLLPDDIKEAVKTELDPPPKINKLGIA